MPLVFFDVTIHIDRDLELQTTKSVACGTTVEALKEMLCLDDPTGMMRSDELSLAVVSGERLKDGQLVTEELGELELVDPEKICGDIDDQAQPLTHTEPCVGEGDVEAEASSSGEIHDTEGNTFGCTFSQLRDGEEDVTDELAAGEGATISCSEDVPADTSISTEVAETGAQIHEDAPCGQLPQQQLRCAHPKCRYLVHSNPALITTHCCKRCHGTPEDEEPKHGPACEHDTGEELGDDSSERKLFNLLDRAGNGKISQRDVLVALRKHAPARRLFGLPAGPNERGGDALQTRLLDIQEAFEAGSGLGELAPIFEKLKVDPAASHFGWEGFCRAVKKHPMRAALGAAVTLLPREHQAGPMFVPTSVWAEVPEGWTCPGGLEYKMDMTTGKNLARLRGGGGGKQETQSPTSPVAAPAASSVTEKVVESIAEKGPCAYRSVGDALFIKRSEDPTNGSISKIKWDPSTLLQATGQLWIGPNGGRWAELDASKGKQRGWALVEGPGFGLEGPALVGVVENAD